ncbi:MAG TPA: hypothetical protein VJ865_01070 [Gemmatimonadaceae bacterium]|nr:hypothetical protein [Gemmatimonadaceae bacterium]
MTTRDGDQVLQIPTSHAEMMALLARRREISDQLESVTDRRSGLINQLRSVPEEGRSSLQAQLKVLDSRVVQLENDLGTVGREIAAASPELISMAYEPSGPPSDDSFAQGAAAVGVPLFLVMSAFYFFSRRRWRRQARNAPSALPSADSERLQRLEHGLEAVAIEVERISEGQRFVTKLLSESNTARTPERVG